MRVLVIGGTGFIGRQVVAALSRAGHDVAIFHRGTGSAVPSTPRRTAEARLPEPAVADILGDRRRLRDYARTLRAFLPDVVVDTVLSSGRQARELMAVSAAPRRASSP